MIKILIVKIGCVIKDTFSCLLCEGDTYLSFDLESAPLLEGFFCSFDAIVYFGILLYLNYSLF